MPRRGGGSSRGKGSGGGNLPREVQISKAMSWLLRHGAKSEGIKMDANGYVNVADLVSGDLDSFVVCGFGSLLRSVFFLEKNLPTGPFSSLCIS